MTVDVCLALGRAVGAHCLEWFASRGSGERPLALIGRDTRRSGPMFEKALTSGLLSVGVDVLSLGVLPTPGVSLLTRQLGADAGLVISASHNPAHDNGVKVFLGTGFKLSDEQESLLEARCLDASTIESADAAEVGKAGRLDDASHRYVRALVESSNGLDLSGRHIVVDCAHGAGSDSGPALFEALGARVTAIGASPDGLNINDDLGAVHPERMAATVKRVGADLGISLDGDADRVIMSDERGDILNGDELLAIGALSYRARGALSGDAIVATSMSNLGLEKYLAQHGIDLVRTDVGDRYVVEAMRSRKHVLGGEQSGHIVALDRGTTGDGLAAALLILGEVVRRDQPLSAVRPGYTPYPQHLVGIKVKEKPPLDTIDAVQAAIRAAERRLGDDGRVVTRYSGTEPKARVMVEGPELGLVEELTSDIVESIRLAIGAQEGAT